MALETMFATAANLEARSQGAIPADHPYAAAALTAATELIRSFCGWHISGEISETVYLDDAGGPIVALPSRRVVSVSALAVNSEPVDVSTLLWLRDGRLAKAYYVPTYRVLEVTMTHGFDTAPEPVKELTLQIASRTLVSPLGLVREQAGAVNVAPTQVAPNVAGGTVLLPHEKALLSPYALGWSP